MSSVSREHPCQSADPARAREFADGIEDFRCHCSKIAAAPRLRMSVDIATAPIGPLTRARARASRYDSGLLVVQTEIPAVSEYVELIVHEFEHVVEPIEGIDFRLTSAGSQITQRADGTFETERARLAGLAATEEVYGARVVIRAANSNAQIIDFTYQPPVRHTDKRVSRADPPPRCRTRAPRLYSGPSLLWVTRHISPIESKAVTHTRGRPFVHSGGIQALGPEP
jgi:hypothetical protein